MNTEQQKQPLQISWWVIAYLVSPGLAFICLRVSRAIGMLECVLGVLAGLIAHYGLVSVLVQTNGEPLQLFIMMLMGVSLFTIIMWQYLAGLRSGFWSEHALKQWRLAGRFFGGFLAVGVVISIILFHISAF